MNFVFKIVFGVIFFSFLISCEKESKNHVEGMTILLDQITRYSVDDTLVTQYNYDNSNRIVAISRSNDSTLCYYNSNDQLIGLYQYNKIGGINWKSDFIWRGNLFTEIYMVVSNNVNDTLVVFDHQINEKNQILKSIAYMKNEKGLIDTSNYYVDNKWEFDNMVKREHKSIESLKSTLNIISDPFYALNNSIYSFKSTNDIIETIDDYEFNNSNNYIETLNYAGTLLGLNKNNISSFTRTSLMSGTPLIAYTKYYEYEFDRNNYPTKIKEETVYSDRTSVITLLIKYKVK